MQRQGTGRHHWHLHHARAHVHDHALHGHALQDADRCVLSRSTVWVISTLKRMENSSLALVVVRKHGQRSRPLSPPEGRRLHLVLGLPCGKPVFFCGFRGNIFHPENWAQMPALRLPLSGLIYGHPTAKPRDQTGRLGKIKKRVLSWNPA